MGYVVKQVDVHDADRLAPVFDAYRQSFNQESSVGSCLKFLRERLRQPGVVFYAIEDEEPQQVLAFAQLVETYSSLTLLPTYAIGDLFVLQHARRQGLASYLMDTCLQHALQRQALEVTMSTATTNRVAQATLLATGWQVDQQYLVFKFAL